MMKTWFVLLVSVLLFRVFRKVIQANLMRQSARKSRMTTTPQWIRPRMLRRS